LQNRHRLAPFQLNPVLTTSTPLSSPAAASPRRLLPTPFGTPLTFTGGGGWSAANQHVELGASTAEHSAGNGNSPKDFAVLPDTRFV
jgi:hypothetical protein